MNFLINRTNDQDNKQRELQGILHSKRIKSIVLSASLLYTSCISIYAYNVLNTSKQQACLSTPAQATQSSQAPVITSELSAPAPEFAQPIKIVQADEATKQAKDEAQKLLITTNQEEAFWRDQVIQDSKDANISFEEGLRRINAGEGIQVTKTVQVEQKQDDDIKYARQIASKYSSNNEIVGYIKIGILDLREPILCHQHDDAVYPDNDYYLSHDINFKESIRGQINTSQYLPLNLDNFNNIIYGHNMADGTMFGSLKKLLNADIQNKDGRDIITIFDQNKKIDYQILAISIKDPSDDFYFNTSYDTFSSEQKVALINRLRSGNIVERFNSTPATFNDQFITLSTCYGPAPSNKRLVVFAKKLGLVYTEK